MNTQLTQYVDSLDDLQRVAELLAASGYFIKEGKPEVQLAQLATKIMAGRELGYGPFAAVQGIHVIQGRPALSANLMAAAVKGHPRYDYRVRQMDNDAAAIEFFELVDGKRESLGTSTFTKQDAAAAQTQNMAKYARNMMFARAISNGVKWFCPDVFVGNTVYVPEELGAQVDGDGEIIDGGYTVAPTPKSQPAPAQPATDEPGPESLDEVEAISQDGDFESIPQHEKAESANHGRMFAILGDTFNGLDTDAARSWVIENWTTKYTPQDIRFSATKLTDEEKGQIADAVKATATKSRKAFEAFQAKAAA